MSKKFKSPNPVGPYSMFKELSSGGWITSGQIPIDPENGTLNNNSFEEEVVQVFNNLEAVLSDNGKSLDDVKKFLVFFDTKKWVPEKIFKFGFLHRVYLVILSILNHGLAKVKI